MAGRIQEFESAVVADCENRRSQEKKRMKNGDCQRKVGCGKRWSVFKHRQHCLSGRRTHWTPPQAISHSAAMMLAAWSALKQRGLCRSMCRSMCLCEPPAIGRHWEALLYVSLQASSSLSASLSASLSSGPSKPPRSMCVRSVCMRPIGLPPNPAANDFGNRLAFREMESTQANKYSQTNACHSEFAVQV